MLRAGVSTACLYPRVVEEALYDLALSGVSNVGTATRFRRGTRADGIVIQHHVFYSV